jgi:hypothetical protein
MKGMDAHFFGRPTLRMPLFALLLVSALRADPVDDLHSPDITVRRAAIQTIQTSDDPRIPPACLPLLNDPGLSIRRLAARAIGSRFWQIADADRPRYLAALRACLAARKGQPELGNYDGEDDISLMCLRAIGLLTRDYRSAPFSVSPDGKWVLYERRRRPVLANMASRQHYLLTPIDPGGATSDTPYFTDGASQEVEDGVDTDVLKTVDTNLPAVELFAPHWRSDGKAVALSFERLERRFYHPILVWSSATPSEVKVLDESSFQPLLDQRYPAWGTTTEFAGWKGDRVLIHVYNCEYPEAHAPDPGVIVSYNIRTGKTAVERDAVAK